MKTTRIKKTVLFLLALFAFAAVFTACGAKKTAEIDIAAFAEELTDSTAFAEELTPIGKDAALLRYGIKSEDAAECAVGVPASVSADEYAIFKASDSDAAKRIKSAIDNYIIMQKASYASYEPDEVPKLDAAIIKTTGLYVIYVCADNSSADGVISKYTK
jgi:hypothetical protein